MSFQFSEWARQKPVIGMLHLLPLPGSPLARPMDEVVAHALADAEILVAGGCHGLMLENFGDVPFFAGQVPPVVVAALTRVAVEVRRAFALPLGINVLRNDGLSAIAVATAAQAQFIRVNVLTGARVTDQGVIQGCAAELLRARRNLGADHIAILADVDVKHSAPLGARDLGDEVKDTLLRGLADGVIVSGTATGAPVDTGKLARVRRYAAGKPVLVGSGVTAQTLSLLATHADGFIVGTALKASSTPYAPVARSAVETLLAAHRQLGNP